MLKFHIIIIKFSIFTNKNSQSDTFFTKLKNIVVKIDIKSFSVCFAWLKSGDFGLEDEERPGQPKKFEGEELEALLDEHCCQTQEELAKSLEVTQAAISKRPKYGTRHEAIIFHHDKARPHVAIPVKNYLENSGWKNFTPPAL